MFDDATEKILSELEKTQKNYWNLERDCAKFLYDLILEHNSKNVLEIGTSNGYSGIWILKALAKTKGRLTTIEYWEKRQSIARQNFALCAPDVVCEAKIGAALVVLEDLSDDIKALKREKFDFVFIDASKKEYLDYFKILEDILSSNAVILADNILTHREKVKPYVDCLFQKKDWRSEIFDMGAGMMLSVKLAPR